MFKPEINNSDRPAPIDRRRFLETLGGGVIATMALPRNLRAESNSLPRELSTNAHPNSLLDGEESFFAGFAKSFTISAEHKYLVASQKGSMPIPVLKHFKEGLDQIAKNPFPVYLEPSEITRGKIARGYGARMDEIAIARNTTDAISHILHGLASGRRVALFNA